MFQVSVRPYVVNHAENPPTFPTHNPHVEAFASVSPENGKAQLAGGEEDKDNIHNVSICQVSLWTEWKLVMNINESIQCSKDLESVWIQKQILSSRSESRGAAALLALLLRYLALSKYAHIELTFCFFQSSELEGRLSAVEAQLESLSGLHRLGVLEKRLEDLERQRNTDKVDSTRHPQLFNQWFHVYCFRNQLLFLKNCPALMLSSSYFQELKWYINLQTTFSLYGILEWWTSNHHIQRELGKPDEPRSFTGNQTGTEPNTSRTELNCHSLTLFLCRMGSRQIYYITVVDCGNSHDSAYFNLQRLLFFLLTILV